MSDFQGKFVWYELMTTDVAAAEGFYGQVLGWSAEKFDGAEIDYTRFSAGEALVAGLMTIPEDACKAGAKPGWMGYVAVDDVDARAAQVVREGGAIHRPAADIPTVGRFAIAADPQGAMFALFKPQGHEEMQPPAPGTAGHGGWHELYAADWQSAFAFYEKLFGWSKADAVDMGPMGTYQLFAAGGQPIGGMMNKPEGFPRPAWLYYFNVDDIDTAAGRVTEEGGQIVHGPMEVPGGSWIVQCLDPQGAMFALVEPAA
jgi:predicted enzyme related to lactoylglutathione lyase